MRGKLIRIIFWSIAISLLLFTLSQLQWRDIVTSIQSLHWQDWIIWLFLNLAIVLLLTWRWHLLLRAFSTLFPFLKLLQIRQAGQTVSFITPGPQFGGEPFQIYWLYKSGVSLRAGIFSLGVDRLLELLANFSVLFLALIFLSAHQSSLVKFDNLLPSMTGILVFMLLSGIVYLFLKRPGWINRLIESLISPWREHPNFQHVRQEWKNSGNDWRVLISEGKTYLSFSVLLSLIGWVGLFAELWLLLHFVSVNAGMQDFLFIFIALRLALLMPIPGGIGTVEAAVLWSFTVLELSVQSAAGLIALMRLRDLVILLVGFYCMKLAGQHVPCSENFTPS